MRSLRPAISTLVLVPFACACSSSGSGTPPPDTAATGTATLPVVVTIPADASASAPDASADAAADSGSGADGGADPDGGAKRPPFTEAHQTCCAPRAEKHAAREADCAAGKAERCAEAAADFKSGCGAPLDPDRASALMDKGCALGHEPTCTADLAEGIGYETDNATLRNLCAKTHVIGCYQLALSMSRYESPLHVLNLYKTACDGGDARACFALADQQPTLAERASVAVLSRKEIIDLNVRGCTLDPIECRRQLGAPGTAPWALPQNKDLIAPMLPVLLAGHEKRCETECDCPNGDVAVWTASVEPERARRYAEKACAIQRDCLPLAELLERGVGGPVDFPRAISLYESRCPGDSAACDHLAAMFEEGRGKDKDPEAARKRAEEACPLVKDFAYPTATILPQSRVYGTLAACARVARYREEGFGGPKDPKGAYQVYYYYCGTAEGVSLCKKRIALGRSLGYP